MSCRLERYLMQIPLKELNERVEKLKDKEEHYRKLRQQSEEILRHRIMNIMVGMNAEEILKTDALKDWLKW